MLSGERLLIVEEEFLIALDVQRVLEGADAQRTVFARNFDEVAKLAGRLADFDLAIVTAPRPGTSDQAVADDLVQRGIAVVVCSATPGDLHDTLLATAEIVEKPFSDEHLVAACRRALDKRAR
jgi:CheY-like chemotaxis protein